MQIAATQSGHPKMSCLMPDLPMTSDMHWYVAQTCSRHEKRVAEHMVARGIEHFLPLYETVSRWQDRRVRLRLPLFPGYIFVRIPLRERVRALEVAGVTRLVGFGGVPVQMPDNEMETIRNGFTSRLRAEPHPYLVAGRRVRIKAGPLAGLKGILVRKKGSFRFVLSVDLIQRSIIADIDIVDIEPSR
jgi:transcription antitermination factor NusG